MNKSTKWGVTLAFIAGSVLPMASAGASSLAEKIGAKYTVVTNDIWYGGQRTVFTFQGHEAWVVEPPAGVSPREGMPWTWTIQWWSAYVPRTGVPKLLKQGYHHVMIDMYESRGSDEALPVFAAFQHFLVDELGFARKTNLIGMSWGGFFSTRYAAHYPQNVNRIYLDCPLLNLAGRNNPNVDCGPWKKFEPVDWTDDPRMPINMVKPIADAKIPILLVYGKADTVLDPRLNSEIFIPRFKKAGGDMRVIVRNLYGHHPHGFEVDETVVEDFINDKRGGAENE